MLALIGTGLISVFAFLSNHFGGQKIYQLLYNASSLSGFIIWLGIAICHLRFRKAWVAQGRSLDDLKFKSKFYPYGPWIAIVLFLAVIFGANKSVFEAPVFSWFDFISSYLVLPLFAGLYTLAQTAPPHSAGADSGLQFHLRVINTRKRAAILLGDRPADSPLQQARAPSHAPR